MVPYTPIIVANVVIISSSAKLGQYPLFTFFNQYFPNTKQFIGCN